MSKVATKIIEASLAKNVQTKDELSKVKRQVTGEFGGNIPATPALRKAYFAILEKDPSLKSAALEKAMTRRDVRSMSGVAIITVLTKPYPCPGKCVYCPTEERMPKSYLSKEPAAARALRLQFDPWKQVTKRIQALRDNGHTSDKIELIVKGGTWSAYPWKYQQWFIKRCFDACNQYGMKTRPRTHSLLETQKLNETAEYRIIGMTLETRPDWISPKEIERLRELGCTRIELGVQSVNDEILKETKRGHDTSAVQRAARLLKDAGYKTDFHMMPQLPGATPASDLAELREIFTDPAYRPDMIKIYPCVVLETAELYDWHKDGSYTPYDDASLVDMLITAKQDIPRYCRISRLIRDIPATYVIAGNSMTNLRQVVQRRMADEGKICACLRCREIGRALQSMPTLKRCTPKLFDDIYEASGGEEHFLSYEDARRRGVFAFCRLRLPDKHAEGEIADIWERIPEIRNAAFIRELHTYGHLVPIDTRNPDASQHKGYGKRLMAEAERIARAAGYKKMAVIAGVGVRGYYRKLGYRLQGTYMVRSL